VKEVAQRLGSKVRLWCTINEPAVYAVQGYFRERFPPAVKDPKHVGIVFRNLLRAHTAAYQCIKKQAPQVQVGLVPTLDLHDPSCRWNLLDIMVSRMLSRSLNESHFTYLIDGIFKFSIPGAASVSYTSNDKDDFDFIGLNYYKRFFQRFALFDGGHVTDVNKAPPEKLTDLGWEIYPEGLYRALEMISRFTSKPIYITENGLADDSDTKRAKYIEDYLLVLNKAIADGMNVKGYFYWSLLDNFEWAFGFEKRFGLYHVDYGTQKRTLREGSKKYLEIIRKSRE
jgi:beta-glucosidase